MPVVIITMIIISALMLVVGTCVPWLKLKGHYWINQTGVSIDHKINFLIVKLLWFEMSITGISKNNWLGQGVYKMDTFVMIHSGRPVPGEITCPSGMKE